MKLRTTLAKVFLAGVLAVAVGCSGGSGSNSASHSGVHAHDMPMGNKAMKALQQKSGQDFDIAFMSQMIAHHQRAIDMAEQTLKVAQRPETKQEAQRVIDVQTQEIAQMNGRLKDWYNTDPSSEQQELMREDISAMGDRQIKDDHMFYDMMIPHHRGVVDMAAIAVEKGQRPELKELASKIHEDQAVEIQKYEGLNQRRN